MTTISWTLYGRIKDYFVWIRTDKGQPIYNITKDINIKGIGGYYRLDSLLKLKGLY